MKNPTIPTLLLITRKYPPSIGGMEVFSHGIITNYLKKYPGYSITYGGSQKWLLPVYLWMFVKALYLIKAKKIDMVWLADGVLTPMGWLLKIFTGKKVVFSAMGKDINFNVALYQKIMPFFFKKMDHVYCISYATLEACVKAGIPREKCSYIPIGVVNTDFIRAETKGELRSELEQKYGIPLKNRKVLLTVGRLAKRKGMQWFIENVLEKLPEEYVYYNIGADSTEVNDFMSWLGLKKVSHKAIINEIIKDKGLEKRAFLLGHLPFPDKVAFLNLADLFIMPNINIPGDMEGFGIVAIEAASAGLPVIGSAMEGIRNSVVDGVTGLWAEPGNPDDFVAKIEKGMVSFDRENVREEAIKRFSWESVVDQYHKQFLTVWSSSSNE